MRRRGGIKQKLGSTEFNLGLIYYAYPGGDGFPDPIIRGVARNPDFFEITGGASGLILEGLFGALNIYYSPNYFGEVGENRCSRET